MMQNNLLTPRGIAAVLLNRNHAKIFERATEVIRAAHFLHILVSPCAIVLAVPKKITLNPSLRWLGLTVVLDEGAFPDTLEDA